MAIADGKKRVTFTLPLDQVADLEKLIEIYNKEAVGKVTGSDVIEQLIKNDLKIRSAFKGSKK